MLEYKKWAEMDYGKKWKVTQPRTSNKNLDCELGAYKLEMTEEKVQVVSVNHRITICVLAAKKPAPRAYQGRHVQQK